MIALGILILGGFVGSILESQGITSLSVHYLLGAGFAFLSLFGLRGEDEDEYQEMQRKFQQEMRKR